jgi:DNA mismatch repair ATPase MutS
MAGVPASVVDRARELLDAETADERSDGRTLGEPDPATNGHGDADDLRERLREVDVGNTTPVEALNALAELKRLAEK